MNVADCALDVEDCAVVNAEDCAMVNVQDGAVANKQILLTEMKRGTFPWPFLCSESHPQCLFRVFSHRDKHFKKKWRPLEILIFRENCIHVSRSYLFGSRSTFNNFFPATTVPLCVLEITEMTFFNHLIEDKLWPNGRM